MPSGALHHRKSLKGNGFTLVELLVTIAVIALLLSLLMPALAAANMVVKRTKCAANMRAVAQSMLVYVNDSDQYLPPLDYSYGNSFNNGFAYLTQATYNLSNDLNETWLAALSEDHTGAPTYLKTTRGECYLGKGMISNLTTNNVLYCPASLPDNNVSASPAGNTLANGGWGGGFNSYLGQSYNPVAPTSDYHGNMFRSAFHELDYASATASTTGNFQVKIGLQSWYGVWGVSTNNNIGLWRNTPIRRLYSDDTTSERQGVKYTSVPNASQTPFLHEGPFFNIFNSVYRVAAPHGQTAADRTTNLAFLDGRVDTYRRSDILPITSGVSTDWTASGCKQYVKASDVKWRMDQ